MLRYSEVVVELGRNSIRLCGCQLITVIPLLSSCPLSLVLLINLTVAVEWSGSPTKGSTEGLDSWTLSREGT